MKKLRVVAIALVLVLFLPNLALANFSNVDQVKVALIGNSDGDKLYYEKNIDEILPVASMSKLMTYLVVMDSISDGKLGIEDTVEITNESVVTDIYTYTNYGLKVGDIFTVKDLLSGMMVLSANDAADALAIKVGGNKSAFVQMMNDKAKELGLSNSSFVNPTGITQPKTGETRTIKDENGEEITVQEVEYNKMSGRDLFTLTSFLVNNYPEVGQYGRMSEIDEPDRNFHGNSTLPLRNNPMMSGLKTGFTEEAGYGFVGLFDKSLENEDRDYKLITVVIGAETPEIRANATEELIGFFNNNYSYNVVLNKNIPYIDYYDEFTKERYIPLYPKESFEKLDAINKEYDVTYKLLDNQTAPYDQGQVLGQLVVMDGDTELETVDLVTRKGYDRLSFTDNLIQSLRDFVDNIMLMF